MTFSSLYISYYLKMNRIEYYDRMTQVRRTGDYEQWISFFLQTFADSAEDAIHTIDLLTALHDKSTKLFDTLTKRQRTSVLKVFSYLESNPIIDIQKTAATLEMSYNTVSKVVSILVDYRILKQTDKFGKATAYVYQKIREAGYPCCILKGQGNAMLYPHTASRTPGDVDVWVDASREEILAERLGLGRESIQILGSLILITA